MREVRQAAPNDPPLPPVNDAHIAGICRNMKNIAIEIRRWEWQCCDVQAVTA